MRITHELVGPSFSVTVNVFDPTPLTLVFTFTPGPVRWKLSTALWSSTFSSSERDHASSLERAEEGVDRAHLSERVGTAEER